MLKYAATLFVSFVLFIILVSTVQAMISTSDNVPTPSEISNILIQQETPSRMVQAGSRMTYTLNVKLAWPQSAHLVITNTLPQYVQLDAATAGTVLLPGGKLVWTTVISPNTEGWTRQIPVTVATGYTGLLTNTVKVTGNDGLSAESSYVVKSVLALHNLYLPLMLKQHINTGNLLSNPGFEGIGISVDNDAPNYGNWTRDTFNGIPYGEIFTPEGWVTWWSEDGYKRPECKVIPNEAPFTMDPPRIYQGYYSGLCFTFFGTQLAGYYQVVPYLQAGAEIEGWYYAHAWACDIDSPGYSCGPADAFSFQVGIEPSGGTDPFSDSIIWSEPYYIYDTFERVGPIQATVGAAGKVTFFLRAHGIYQFKHNDAYWDNPTLVYVQR